MMLPELLYNNSAESYSSWAYFVKGGTHLLSKDYAKWGDPPKKQPKSLEISALVLVPAIVCSELLCIAISFCAGSSRGEVQQAVGRTTDLPDHKLPQWSVYPQFKPSRWASRTSSPCFSRVSRVPRVREEITDVRLKHGRPGSLSACCASHSRGLPERALPRCKALGRCSGHCCFYLPWSISQEPRKVPGQLPPLLNRFGGIRTALKLKGHMYHQSPVLQISLQTL